MTLKEYLNKKLQDIDASNGENFVPFLRCVEKVLSDNDVLDFIGHLSGPRILGTFLRMYPKYSLHMDVIVWEKICIPDSICIIADLDYCDIDIERMLCVMHSEDLTLVTRSIITCAFILEHPRLLQDVPMDKFPIKGYSWYTHFKGDFREEYFPSGAEELIEEQQVLKKIAACRNWGL